jgi:glycerol uptake operon antiterminator
VALKELLVSQRIIPAVRNQEDLTEVLKQEKFQLLVLLFGDINTLPGTIETVRRAGRKVIIHMDLLDGIAKDRAGVSFLAKLRPYGLISTKSQVIKAAKEEGLIAIQRLFAVDSESVRTGIQSMRNSRPDAVEFLPGTIPGDVIEELQSTLHIPVIAGGLLRTKHDVEAALAKGAIAVTTSRKYLYKNN